MAFAISSLAWCALFTINLLAGWVFLFKLEIKSPLWQVWTLSYTLSVIIIFRVMPFIAFSVLVWAILGKWVGSYTKNVLWVAVACVALLGMSGALVLLLYNQGP